MLKDIGNSDFICLTETHLHEDDVLPEIDNYIGYHERVRSYDPHTHCPHLPPI